MPALNNLHKSAPSATLREGAFFIPRKCYTENAIIFPAKPSGILPGYEGTHFYVHTYPSYLYTRLHLDWRFFNVKYQV